MGLAYRSAWVKGNMDGKQLEPFEDSQLFILCLSPYAFGKADRSSLMALSKDLNLASMVKSAVVEWKLEAHCPLVSNSVFVSIPADLLNPQRHILAYFNMFPVYMENCCVMIDFLEYREPPSCKKLQGIKVNDFCG